VFEDGLEHAMTPDDVAAAITEAGCTRRSSRESTTMSGSDPNTSIVPPTKSIDGAPEVRENLERHPSLGRKHAVYNDSEWPDA
jgi:hypothetical protein